PGARVACPSVFPCRVDSASLPRSARAARSAARVGAVPGVRNLASGRGGRAVKHGRVLLADSHLGMLGGVHSLLDALFETVLMVADERSLMEAVTRFAPNLIVVDLPLPGDGDANIARRLMEGYPKLRVIILTVHAEPTV